ncbi:zinc finger protein 22-like isoform X1 [Clytia hemisphaerica]|uniref:C2H2-type domain-containing protein n=1 Tax=Clytia hemisphaerica TaxID=252671 RepID=A0A7M5USG3_9CNID
MNEFEEIKIKVEQEEDHGCNETNHEHLEILIKLEDESVGYSDDENMEPIKNHENELSKNSCRNVKGNDVTSSEETNPQNYEISIKLEDESKPQDNQSAKSMQFLENRNSVNINDGTNCFDQLSPNAGMSSQIGEEITIKFEDELERFQNHENENIQECFEANKTENSNNDHLTGADGFDYDQSIKPFKCNECGERFYQESTLTRHKGIHKGYKYRCKQCDKGYNAKNALIQHHKDLHKDLKSFKCDKCHKAFSSETYLTIHQRSVHEGVKPFECQVCGKCFALKRQLTSHHRFVHEEASKGC